jgi:hypothetical protein
MPNHLVARQVLLALVKPRSVTRGDASRSHAGLQLITFLTGVY